MPRHPDTKQRIERAALELFVNKGIAETTTKDIAKAVKISEATIYRHFSSKDDLARELFERQHILLAEALSAAAASEAHINAQVRAIVTAYCHLADADWLLFRYHQLSQAALLRYFSEDLPNPVDVVVDVIDHAIHRKELPPCNPSLYAAMALGVVLQAATFKAFGRLEGPFEDLSHTFSEAVMGVLRSANNLVET